MNRVTGLARELGAPSPQRPPRRDLQHHRRSRSQGRNCINTSKSIMSSTQIASSFVEDAPPGEVSRSHVPVCESQQLTPDSCPMSSPVYAQRPNDPSAPTLTNCSRHQGLDAFRVRPHLKHLPRHHQIPRDTVQHSQAAGQQWQCPGQPVQQPGQQPLLRQRQQHRLRL